MSRSPTLQFRHTVGSSYSVIEFTPLFSFSISRFIHVVVLQRDLSDECFGAKLRVTENRYVVFDFSSYVCFALLSQH